MEIKLKEIYEEYIIPAFFWWLLPAIIGAHIGQSFFYDYWLDPNYTVVESMSTGLLIASLSASILTLIFFISHQAIEKLQEIKEKRDDSDE